MLCLLQASPLSMCCCNLQGKLDAAAAAALLQYYYADPSKAVLVELKGKWPSERLQR